MSLSAMARLRRLILGAVVAVLAQAGIGMVVNLYAMIPAHHPGAHPSDYFAGSARSVMWAISHGAAALAIHATLGLGVVVLAVAVDFIALRQPNRALKVWLILAVGLVIGAGFNGASFLDFNQNTSSLLMASMSAGQPAAPWRRVRRGAPRTPMAARPGRAGAAVPRRTTAPLGPVLER